MDAVRIDSSARLMAERDALLGDPGWELVDSRRYGAARFHFLRRAPR